MAYICNSSNWNTKAEACEFKGQLELSSKCGANPDLFGKSLSKEEEEEEEEGRGEEEGRRKEGEEEEEEE